MNKEDYLAFTHTVAIYPEANTKNAVEAMYLLLGYMSETHEYHSVFTGMNYTFEELRKELGDRVWYLTRLEWLFENAPTYNAAYQYDIFGAIKKFHRDGTIKPEINGWIERQWQTLEMGLADINASSGNIKTMDDIRELNMSKLARRQEGGTLSGSGDDR